MKDPARLELSPGVWLDAGRAVFLEEHRLLAVADLHLGYAWAQRAAGQLVPFGRDRTLERLHLLIGKYSARELVVLGDIVHAVVASEPFEKELTAFLKGLTRQLPVHFIIGNHDRRFASLSARLGVELSCGVSHRAGPWTFVHGHEDAADGRLLFMGHEHPAITVSDGIANAVRCPCFLSGPQVTVLPAFSEWAAGSNVRAGHFLSPIAAREQFSRAVAILGSRLLPLPLRTAPVLDRRGNGC